MSLSTRSPSVHSRTFCRSPFANPKLSFPCSRGRRRRAAKIGRRHPSSGRAALPVSSLTLARTSRSFPFPLSPLLLFSPRGLAAAARWSSHAGPPTSPAGRAAAGDGLPIASASFPRRPPSPAGGPRAVPLPLPSGGLLPCARGRAGGGRRPPWRGAGRVAHAGWPDFPVCTLGTRSNFLSRVWVTLAFFSDVLNLQILNQTCKIRIFS